MSAVSKGAKPACEPCRMRRIPKTPHRARGEVIWWHATELDVASRRAGAFSFEMFLTRCFSPCSDEIIGYCRTRPRTGGLSQGQTARRRTQHNEAPFESDATNSMKGAIIVSIILSDFTILDFPNPRALLCCV